MDAASSYRPRPYRVSKPRSKPARGANQAPRGARTARRAPRPAARSSTAARVRWDRLGHLAMLLVLVALLYLYLSAGIHIFSTWQQEGKDSAAVRALEREHRALVSQHEALGRQGTVEVEARALNMVGKGERPFIISGLPNN
jgi:hypothetical protein